MIILYEKNETDFTHNGWMILQPIEAIVTEELNEDYSLKVTMPRGSQLIENEQIIKAPTPKTDQLFRVYNSDIDMLGNPVFYARHIFYDLLDYFIEDTRPTGSGADAISKILANTPFTGSSDFTKQGTAYYQMMSPVKAILGADNSFIEVWGGELERDNFQIRIKNHIGSDRGVSIRYRKNLTGLRFVTDLSSVATKIMPTGLKEDGQTLLKLPEKYVKSPLIDAYTNEKVTRIHYSEIKIGEKMSEIETLNALRDAANLEFKNGLDKPQITATVEFITLEDTEEYKDFSILETVYLGDFVSVHHEDLNIDLMTKVIGYEFDALSKRYNKVTLGNANPKYGDIQRQYVDKINNETRFMINNEIIDTEKKVTQEFKAADGELSSIIEATYVTKSDASGTYATKTALRQTAEEISTEVSKKVNNSEFGTKITQNATSVQIAWNNISEIIQFIYASLRIYDGSGSGKQLLMQLDKNGEGFYRNGCYVGKIGTNIVRDDNSKRGLVFDLDEGNYMTWAAKDSPNDNVYTMKMSYYKDNSIGQKGIDFGDNLYMNNWDIYDTTIQTSSDKRLKKDIHESGVDALSIINALSCMEFKWKADGRFEELGFIAQQVKEVNPRFVGEKIIDGETYYTLDLMAIIPYLVKAVQELSEKIGAQVSDIATFSAKSPNEYQRPKPVELKFRELADGKIEIFKEEATT